MLKQSNLTLEPALEQVLTMLLMATLRQHLAETLQAQKSAWPLR